MSVVGLPTPSSDPLSFFWFIPTHGDGSYLGSERQQRPAEFPYFKQVAQAVDQLGYEGVLLPTGQSCEDAWITATALATVTERLKYLVALRPGVVTPAFAARQTAALDRLSGGRLLLNVVCGGNPVELAGDGVFLPHDERYAQADEFLRIWCGLLSGETVNFEGKYYAIKGGRLDFPPVQSPYPPLYFGGSSDAGQDLAAEQTDLYLTWGEPVAGVAEKIEAVRRKASARGRKLRFGMRIHFIVRETSEEAWAAADRLISRISDAQIEAAQKRFGEQMDSVGQRRMAALHGGRRDKLEVAPNLLAGVGLVRTGAGTALVGRSGCGKSTLLRLLVGLDTPSTGEVRVGTEPDTRRSSTRLMFQEPRLLPWQRVIANVEVGLDPSLPAATRHEQARSALRQVGLEDRAGEWPSVLSGGQRQRVALARALVSRPRFLALDEPLGALDALTRIEMQGLVERIWQAQGFTAVLVTHDVAEAVALADRVVVIDAGRVALDIPIDIPRPRRRGDAELARLGGRIIDHLFNDQGVGI